MHWTALLAKRFLPPEARVIDDVACIHCGFNLRTLRATGYCTECNHLVGDSLLVLAKPEAVASGLRAVGKGHLAVFGLLLGCVNLGAFWPQLFSVGILLTGAIWQVFGIIEIRFRASLENLPVVAPRLRLVFVLTLVYASVLLVWLVAILAIAFVPTLSPGAISAMLGISTLMWTFSWLALMAASGWFGLAMGNLIGHSWMVIEFRIQLALFVLCGAASLPLAFIRGSSLPPTALPGAIAVLGLVPMLAVLLTSVGYMHLANAAEQTFDTVDEAISRGRVAITPRHANEFRDSSDPVEMTSPEDPHEAA